MFQHTATRRWLPGVSFNSVSHFLFQHTATRRWLPMLSKAVYLAQLFQHTATRRWLPQINIIAVIPSVVSTHSHPKVAAPTLKEVKQFLTVSTHSHPKVAAGVSFNSVSHFFVSTHSHPKVAACYKTQNTLKGKMFQHTATRRWLPNTFGRFASKCMVSTHSHPKVAAVQDLREAILSIVSTHSHPKVAAPIELFLSMWRACFNTQPPEGGCKVADHAFGLEGVSTHSHPKVAAASLKSLAPSGFAAPISLSFQEKREREYNTAFSVIPTFTIF